MFASPHDDQFVKAAVAQQHLQPGADETGRTLLDHHNLAGLRHHVGHGDRQRVIGVKPVGRIGAIVVNVDHRQIRGAEGRKNAARRLRGIGIGSRVTGIAVGAHRLLRVDHHQDCLAQHFTPFSRR